MNHFGKGGYLRKGILNPIIYAVTNIRLVQNTHPGTTIILLLLLLHIFIKFNLFQIKNVLNWAEFKYTAATTSPFLI